ncbi:exopolyphosphatase/guanosine-5'-triphosphate,3'-diphosphate pyrophosphatase [Natronospira proteinivora]|uniref:Exopolyphosphatase/guanosine-5'-triphosphate, 3'-diphosphate pyrophosphatase n=1 Tax=Natronospira proteinivora TaxID=1807133 RepID=A0ABT1GB09_9GAMM|nr:Ppx/GppA phosphatase family protein [Natronospira proteinivora]MCP1728484.1 exopolyphosphatase/guanosine-5'-triphosphate,3'-diphosphate pyrophosphatase [Natronospira proteinivora]
MRPLIDNVRDMLPPRPGERVLAAVDLGSNSFHLIVACLRGHDLHVVDRIKATVRLRSGLTDEGDLSSEARSRALACLARFGERLKGMDSTQVRAVGTDALRRAADQQDFLEAAENALGHPIEVISGYEEARLIYAGATPDATEGGGRRLVLDIGGGSTEIILGAGSRPDRLESLGVGSVSLTERCFEGLKVTEGNMDRALSLARGELSGVAPRYCQLGWETALGASGTIRSIAELSTGRGWSDEGITLKSLKKLRAELIQFGTPRASNFPELNPDRVAILPGGVAILQAVFEVMAVERMQLAPGALREGLLDDMAGRIRNKDVRHRTVTAMMQRHRLDRAHGRAVAETAAMAWDAVAPSWGLDERPETRNFLVWAASLHEIGLSISHNQHHRHGAYVLANADMAGFSRDDQAMLAVLARLQRKKLSRRHMESIAPRHRPYCLRLAALLRVAIALHRGRDKGPAIQFKASDEKGWQLVLPQGWLDEHPLLSDDLSQEVAYQKAAGIRLDIV